MTSPGPTERAEVLARVRSALLAAGASPAEIDQAESDNVLDLLMADRLLVPAQNRFTEEEVAQRTGMPTELARRFWRALGFADVEPDDRVFTDLDVEAILLISNVMALGVADVDSGLQLARVIGSSMARIAEAEVTPALTGSPLGTGTATGDSLIAADQFARMAGSTLPSMVKLLEFSWRRHVQAATRRAMSLRTQGNGTLPTLCVGFADMVGFTSLSQQVSEGELGAVVSRFEEVAHDTVTAAGGRLVKMIGDEAMFITPTALDASRIALKLVDEYGDDELLSDVRVGLALGPVLIQDGDYYGPVVNLAHRIVVLADPGSIVVSDDFRTSLLHDLHPASSPDDTEVGIDIETRAVRPRQVKDVGRVQLWALSRPGAQPRVAERKAGRGWERVAEVLRDIEELRERGERVLATGLRAAPVEPAALPDQGSGSGEPDGGDAEGP